MPEQPMQSVLGEVERLLDTGVTATDRQLLERFLASRDEAAFGALIERHGPMVLGVCRRLLRHVQDAEDAFQATFMVLARKARAVCWNESVAPWLHAVASRVARKQRAAVLLRHTRENQMRDRTDDASSAPVVLCDDLREVIDEELGRLPVKYRSPMVLCYLEGKSNTEAAEALGWSKGTVSGRLARARDVLRGRLARRGVTLSAAALSAVLTPQVLAVPVPNILASTALKTALGIAAPATAAAALAGSVLTGSKPARWVMLLVCLCVGTLGAGLVVWAYQARTAPPDPELTTGPETPDPDPTKRPRSWRLQSVLHAGNEQLHALAFSPDCLTLATASAGGKVKLWDLRTKKVKREAQDHQSAVLALFFSPDGKTLTSAGARGEVLVWDLTRDRQQAARELGPVGMSSAVFSPDGKTLACITSPFLTGLFAPPEQQGRFQPIQLWDLKTGKALRGFSGHALVNAQVCFSPDGKTVVSVGARPRVKADEENGSPAGVTVAETKLWDVATGREVALPRGGLSVAFSPDGALLAYGGYDEAAKQTHIDLWDVKAARSHSSISDVGDAGALLCFSPDSKQLVAGGVDTQVKVWDLPKGRKRISLEGHQTTLAQLVFSPNGDLLATADWAGDIRVWTSRDVK